MKRTTLSCAISLALAVLILFLWDQWAQFYFPPAGKDHKVVTMIGAVKNPGAVPFRDGMTAYELLMDCGGLTNAERASSFVLRGPASPFEPMRVWLTNTKAEVDRWLFKNKLQKWHYRINYFWPEFFRPRGSGKIIGLHENIRGGDIVDVPGRLIFY